MSRLFNRWAMLALSVVVAMLFFVWRDIAEQTSDSVSSFMSTDIDPPALNDADLQKVEQFWLARPFDNAFEIKVEALALVSDAASGSEVRFRLRNAGLDNHFPSLAVSVYGADRSAALRNFTLAPNQYKHGADFRDVDVRLPVSLRPGETSVTVAPIYAQQGMP